MGHSEYDPAMLVDIPKLNVMFPKINVLNSRKARVVFLKARVFSLYNKVKVLSGFGATLAAPRTALGPAGETEGAENLGPFISAGGYTDSSNESIGPAYFQSRSSV